MAEQFYKYFNSSREKSLRVGNVYINTFANIRRMDCGGSIGDLTEGGALNKANYFELDFSAENAKSQYEVLEKLRCVKFSGNKLPHGRLVVANSVMEQSVDAFMYCVTEARDDDYWRGIPVEEGGPYDRCMHIKDMQEFAKRISLVMPYRGGHISFGACEFESNEGLLDNNTLKKPNLRRKPDEEKFRTQKEHRLIILPVGGSRPIEPVLVTIKIEDIVDFITI